MKNQPVDPEAEMNGLQTSLHLLDAPRIWG